MRSAVSEAHACEQLAQLLLSGSGPAEIQTFSVASEERTVNQKQETRLLSITDFQNSCSDRFVSKFAITFERTEQLWSVQFSPFPTKSSRMR